MAPVPGKDPSRSSLDVIGEVVENRAVNGRRTLLRRCRPGRSLEDDYRLAAEVLGTGLNGGVQLAIRCDLPSQRVAVKRMSLEDVSDRKRENILAAVAIHLCTDHPHIARLLDVYESSNSLELAIECLHGGELLDRVTQEHCFSEGNAAQITRQLLWAISYMHSQGIVHRDLKHENVMFTTHNDKHVKLIGFGLSQFRRDGDKKMYIAPEAARRARLDRLAQMELRYLEIAGESTEAAGDDDAAAAAPPVLESEQDSFNALEREDTIQCESWSLGIIVFVLLSGQMPFYGSDADQMRNIEHGLGRVSHVDRVSHVANEFVQCLMNVDPNIRLTAKQALHHPWIARYNCQAAVQMSPCILDTLCGYLRAPALQRYCRKLVAHMLSNKEHTRAWEVFDLLDASNTGVVTVSGSLARLVADKANFKELSSSDCIRGQKIEYLDLLAAMIPVEIAVSDEVLSAAFRRFGTDDSGCICWSDLCNESGQAHEDDHMTALIKRSAKKLDGKMSQATFRDFVCGSLTFQPASLSNEADIQDPSVVFCPEPQLLPTVKPLDAMSPLSMTPASWLGTPTHVPTTPTTRNRKGSDLHARVCGPHGIPGLETREYPVLLPYHGRAVVPDVLPPLCSSNASSSIFSRDASPIKAYPAFASADASPTCSSEACRRGGWLLTDEQMVLLAKSPYALEQQQQQQKQQQQCKCNLM